MYNHHIGSEQRKATTTKAINTIHGIIRIGDKVVISGSVKETWSRSVIEITPQYIKVAGLIKFNAETLVSRECAAHRIMGVADV